MSLGVAFASASLLTGLANLGLLFYLRRLPDRPGLAWFQGVIACQAVFCGAYGTGLLLGRSWFRVPLLIAFWLAAIWIGVCYLGFALAYTGRARYVRSTAFRAVVAVQAAASVLVLTSPYHEFGVRSVEYVQFAGVYVQDYQHTAFVYFEFGVVALLSTVGVALLLDTVLSYGPLYRKHAFAIAVTPIPPIVAFVAWLLQLGPLYPLNLTALAFFPHLLLDLYALFGEDMFEFPPATRRTAERAAVDDLGNPVVVVDPDDRIVRLNAAASDALGVPESDALTTDLGRYLQPVDDDVEGDHVRIAGDPKGRVFARTLNDLVDGAGTPVGSTVVFQDVTMERRREQRVAVLNRVLRHNLRNDLTVVLGNVNAAAEATDDETVASLLETAAAQTEELSALGERAREVDATMSRTGDDDREFAPARVLASVAADLDERYPDATVAVDVPDDLALTADLDVFRVVFENLLENGIIHDDGARPEVSVGVWNAPAADGGTASDPTNGDEFTFAVEDRGPGIPEHELDVLDAGRESSLEHGSGLGLWVANWGVTALGGDLSFDDREEGGTRVLVSLASNDPPIDAGDT